jgi:uncharacterized protein (DUF111 family)
MQKKIQKYFIRLKIKIPSNSIVAELSKDVPLQTVTRIFAVDGGEMDKEKVAFLKENVGDEIYEMLNLVVDEVFRRAESDSLVSAIVLVTRITGKLNPPNPSPLLRILCQTNEKENDGEQLKVIFPMIKERLELTRKGLWLYLNK